VAEKKGKVHRDTIVWELQAAVQRRERGHRVMHQQQGVGWMGVCSKVEGKEGVRA